MEEKINMSEVPRRIPCETEAFREVVMISEWEFHLGRVYKVK